MKLTVSFVTLLALAAGAYAQQTSNSLLPQPALQELSPTPLPGQAPPNDNPVQETASDPSDMAHMTAEDYLAMELPPLGVLIDNSRQTAQMQYYNTAIDEAKTDLKTERRNWLKYFRATGNYQYGQMTGSRPSRAATPPTRCRWYPPTRARSRVTGTWAESSPFP